MAGSVGSIYVDLLLHDGSFKSGFKSATASVAGFSKYTKSSISKVNSSFLGMINPINSVTAAVRNLGVGIGAAMSVDKIIKYSDAWRQATGRLSLVSKGADDVAMKQEQLFDIAQRTRQPLGDILNFYARLNQFIPENERAQYDLLGVTESVNTAIAITGETALSAQAAMIQFTQGIGTNFEASGQELRSLQELAPRLTQALQKAIGDGTQSLQALVKAGKLTRTEVLNALSGMGEEGRKLREELAKVPVTVSQAFTQLDNALLKYLGSSESVTNSTGALAAAIKSLADNLDRVIPLLVQLGTVVVGVGLFKLASGAFKFASGLAVAGVAASSTVKALNIKKATQFSAKLALASKELTGMKPRNVAANFALASKELTGMSSAFTKVSTSSAKFLAGLTGIVSFLGGPWVVALTTGYLALKTFGDSNEFNVGQKELKKIFYDISTEYANFGNLSDEQKKKLESNTNDEIKSLERKREEYHKLYLKMRDLSTIPHVAVDFMAGLSSALDFDYFGLKSPEQLRELLLGADSVIRKIKAMQETAKEGVKITIRKTNTAEIDRLFKKYQTFITGVSQEQIKFQQVQEDFAKYAKLTGASDEDVQLWIDRYKKSLSGFKTWTETIEEMGKEAARNIQDAFAEFLFDPFEDGLSGMVTGFAEALRKMVANAVAVKLGEYLFGDLLSNSSGSSSASGTNILSSVGSWFAGFFADGGVIGPGQWGVVGEEGAELVYGGNTGASVIPQGAASAQSGGTVVNIINNTTSTVSARENRTQNGTSIEVLIDEAVARNMTRSGTKTNQALSAYNNRGIVRR